jgi:hypothetical protein
VLACVIGPLLIFLTGTTGNTRFWLSLFAILPVYFAMLFITIGLFAPEIETTGECRAILYDEVADDIPVNAGRHASEPAERERQAGQASGVRVPPWRHRASCGAPPGRESISHTASRQASRTWPP